MTYNFSIKFRFWRGILLAFSIATLTVLSAPAVTIHRSFRTREAGFGCGTGTAGVAYPVDARIDKAIDEARQKEAEKVKVVIGLCTKVIDGDTIHVVTGGNVRFKVRLERIDAPESDQPYGKEATDYLAKLIKGRTVRVEWVKKDRYGRILGIVYYDQPGNPNSKPNRQDINLTMVSTGNAWHYKFYDKTTSYAEAEKEAREKKLGLWVDPDPVEPYQFRKMKKGRN